MLTELSDSIINGIEAYASLPNMPELATKNIKETLDKRYGPAWHVVIGEGYAYDISVQSGAYLLMYYNGNLGCLVFKTWYHISIQTITGIIYKGKLKVWRSLQGYGLFLNNHKVIGSGLTQQIK